MRRFLILSLFLPSLALAQQQAETPQEIPYAAVFFQQGLPDFKPLHNQIQQDGQTATIPLPGSDHAVSFVWGKNSEGKAIYRVMHHKPDSTVSLVFPPMQPDAYGTLSATIDLRFDLKSGVATPLRLRLLPLHNALLYRWTGSGLQAVGGVPTARPSALRIGEAVPDFAVQTLEGSTIRLRDFEGKTVVINSWATSCGPCIAEMPGLNSLVEKYTSDGVVFLAIALDTEEDVRAFLEQQAFLYQQALASEATTALFGETFPRNVIVDRSGLLVYDRTEGGADTYKKLDEELAALTGAN